MMAAPFGFAFYTWLKANPAVMWIAGIGTALAGFLSWQRLRDIRIRREERKRIDAKAKQTAGRVIDKAKDRSDETIRKADDARARVPDGPYSHELPDDIQRILFGDREDG
jgi:hypothetical protein